MIEIRDKKDCCGCSACVQKCPKHCISMIADDEGFLYPSVSDTQCINCGICEKVCPILNPQSSQIPKSTLLVINKNENEKLYSSSGGCFTLLAKAILNKGGVVYGAAFKQDWTVHHIRIDNEEQLKVLRGSKYVQSNVENTFKEAEKDLKDGTYVLYSGTPCQISALKLFLRKDFDNLITVDLICHGVPSPSVWYRYLQKLTNDNIESVKNITFRDKENGWRSYQLTVNMPDGSFSSPYRENSYLQGMMKNLYLRPSCYDCPTKKGRSHSDITLADFWSVWVLYPEEYDKKGTSLVLANTIKGEALLSELSDADISKKTVDFEDAIYYNQAWMHSAAPHSKRKKFFVEYKDNEELDLLISSLLKTPLIKRIKNVLHSTLCKWGLWSTPEQRRQKKIQKDETE